MPPANVQHAFSLEPPKQEGLTSGRSLQHAQSLDQQQPSVNSSLITSERSRFTSNTTGAYPEQQQ